MPNGRCYVHGGASTGPKTLEGRKRISDMRKAEWAKWREQMGLDPSWRYGKTWLSRRKRETAADRLARDKLEEPTP
jgi:hypothetical protein